jgi:cobalt/nickel transport protein
LYIKQRVLMNKKDILIGLSVALILAGVASRFASPSPDGLERIAQDKGFSGKREGKPATVSPVAAVFGTVLVFGAAYGAAVLIKRKGSA